MSEPARTPTQIAIAVVEHKGCYLVGQRPPGVALAGLSEFPGGKVEINESPAAAAIRECLEEAGLRVEVICHYPDHVHNYEHDRVQLHFFACRLIDQVATPTSPYRWVPRAELANLEFPAGNRELLNLLTGQP